MSMKKLLVGLLVLNLSVVASAFEVVLQNKDGTPHKDAEAVELKTTRSVSGNVETVRCLLRSKSGKVQMLRLTASDRLPGATRAWNGKDELACPKSRYEKPLYFDFTFLMGALWKPGSGLALGTGAEDFNSHADLRLQGDDISVSVHAALMQAGAVYECTFHRISFDPKYGIRDALARYYPLYPRRFFRSPEIVDGFYGISAQYGSFRYADPEVCRLGNASWEWCHGADRVWGDLLNVECPQGECFKDYCWVEPIAFHRRDGKYVGRDNSKISREEYDRQLAMRFADGYYCGVANGFYSMLVAYISKAIGERYPDSLATGDTCSRNEYPYAASVFAFPECSWGREVRRQMCALVEKCDIGGMAFDVTQPNTVYRGERLSTMRNVSWDHVGPGVVRGIANDKFYDFIRTLPTRKLAGKMAVAGNSFYEHVSDLLYLDMTMFERPPWGVALPFPLQGRYALWEKGMTLWEGYEPESFDPNFKSWPVEAKSALENDLARFSVHRSFLTAASLPLAFRGEYVTWMSHAFVRMNKAGWKPVTGAVPKGSQAEIARYGLAERSWLAVCNLTNAQQRVVLDVFPDEIENGVVGEGSKDVGFVYAPFFGGEAENRFHEGKEQVSVRVGPLGVRVLESVCRVRGSGTLFARWEGDGCGKVSLVLRSQDFQGSIVCRPTIENYQLRGGSTVCLNAGETITRVYCDPLLLSLAEELVAKNLVGQKTIVVEYSADSDSKEMAERIAYFFKTAAKKTKMASMPSVKLLECPSLDRLSVVLEGCPISAVERVSFSRHVRRVLNVLNARLCPDYKDLPAMESRDREYLNFIRY